MTLFTKIVFVILFLIIDFALWVGIGLILLQYEDFYDESKGEYFSLASMTILEKTAYISYYLWVILNLILIVYIVFKLIHKYMIKH